MPKLTHHIGRSFSGHELEDRCPCVKAPCGLVSEYDPECPEHAPGASKTIRQSHLEFLCPTLIEEARRAMLNRLDRSEVSDAFRDEVNRQLDPRISDAESAGD